MVSCQTGDFGQFYIYICIFSVSKSTGQYSDYPEYEANGGDGGDGGDGGGSPGRVQEAAGGKHPSSSLRNICGPAFASYSLGYALILMH